MSPCNVFFFNLRSHVNGYLELNNMVFTVILLSNVSLNVHVQNHVSVVKPTFLFVVLTIKRMIASVMLNAGKSILNV